MSVLKHYWSLVKPGILFGNLLTAASGFALASRGSPHFFLLGAMLLGIGTVVAGACVFNNYLDRHADAKMTRTQHRALVLQTVSGAGALLLGFTLSLFGVALLLLLVNTTTAVIASLGLLIYVGVYSPLKYRSAYATLVGSFSGSVPPLVGYCAATALDAGGVLLFLAVMLWQMPHFFAISLYRLPEYAEAGIPVWPIIHGISSTKYQSLFYLIAFLIPIFMLPALGYAGPLYTMVMVLAVAFWLWIALKGFHSSSAAIWGKRVFLSSLVVVTLMSLALFLDPLSRSL